MAKTKNEIWECPVCGVQIETVMPASEVYTPNHKKYKCRGKLKKITE